MNTQRRVQIKSYLLALFFCLLAIAFDQYTKWLAVQHLKDQEPFIIIRGVFQLYYLENQGAAFGIFQGLQKFFMIGAIVISLLVAWAYSRLPHTKRYYPLRICAVLIVSGAIGNMIDRIRQNYVVDFFYFNLIDFPVFNVADCYVVIACFLFAALILFYYKDHDLEIFALKKEKKD